MNRTVARLAAPMFVVLGLSLAAAAPAAAQEIIVSHGSSLVGELKYGPDFTNFEYANPDAPTGGDVKFWAFGSYDTLNPFTLKGRPASGIGLIFDTLMVGSADEPSSHYGLIAEEVAQVLPELAPLDEEGNPLSVNYQMLTPMLLNEVQKQQRTIHDQREAIGAQQQVIAALTARVEAVERSLSSAPGGSSR